MIQSGALVIDVRSEEEFAEGHLDGAINIEWDQTDALIAAIGSDKQRQVVFYCRSGNRSGKSMAELESRGYTHIFNATGFEALQATKPDLLTKLPALSCLNSLRGSLRQVRMTSSLVREYIYFV